MTLLGGGSPPIRPFDSGRYVHTNPLRREFGLRLLSEPLPEPLRTSFIRAWRRPARYDGKQAIQITCGMPGGCRATLEGLQPTLLVWSGGDGQDAPHAGHRA